MSTVLQDGPTTLSPSRPVTAPRPRPALRRPPPRMTRTLSWDEAFAALPASRRISGALRLALSVRDRPLGSSSLYRSGGRRRRDLSEQAMDPARVFASRAAVVLTNALAHDDLRHERDRLRHALDARAVVDHAAGVIIARTGVTADQTLAHLSARSRASARTLAQVAADVVRAAQQAGAQQAGAEMGASTASPPAVPSRRAVATGGHRAAAR